MKKHIMQKNKPITNGQVQYYKAIESSVITICNGPAGSGKTYIALLAAINIIEENQNITKIVVSRPTIEAGEQLGFLPGNVYEKTKPFMDPIFKTLKKLSHDPNILINKKTIEIAQLAYMRGETYDNSIMILDEAQNTTEDQMLMFLTRLGTNSKIIIIGDLSQSDIIDKNGLNKSIKCLAGLSQISIIQLSQSDIVRNDLIAKIINQFNKFKINK